MRENIELIQKQLYDIEEKFIRYLDAEYNTSNSIQQKKLKKIVQIVADYHDMSPRTMKRKCREGHIKTARQRCHYFINRYTSLPQVQIGLRVGNLDRTTVIHSIKTVQDLMLYDKAYSKEMEELDQIIDENLQTKS